MNPKKKPVIFYRPVPLTLRTEPDFRALSASAPCAQTLYLHLITCGHDRTIPGLLVVGLGQLADELSMPGFEWSTEDVRRCFKEIADRGLAVADWGARVVWIKSQLRPDWNEPSSWKNLASWGRHWGEVPDCALKWAAYEYAARYCAERDRAKPPEKDEKGQPSPSYIDTLTAKLTAPEPHRGVANALAESLKKPRASQMRSQIPSETASQSGTQSPSRSWSQTASPPEASRSRSRSRSSEGENARSLARDSMTPSGGSAVHRSLVPELVPPARLVAWLEGYARGLDERLGLVAPEMPSARTTLRDDVLAALLVLWASDAATAAWATPEGAERAARALSRSIRSGDRKSKPTIERVVKERDFIEALLREGDQLQPKPVEPSTIRKPPSTPPAPAAPSAIGKPPPTPTPAAPPEARDSELPEPELVDPASEYEAMLLRAAMAPGTMGPTHWSRLEELAELLKRPLPLETQFEMLRARAEKTPATMSDAQWSRLEELAEKVRRPLPKRGALIAKTRPAAAKLSRDVNGGAPPPA